MFGKNRRIKREAQRVIKRKTPQKVRTILYGKRGRRIESVSSVLSVEVLMGRGGDINWRRIPICICVLGVKEVVRPQLTVKAIYSSNFEVQRKKH